LFFAMLLGAALQITNMFGDTLSEILVLNWVSRDFWVELCINYLLSQISETLFILTIPFFLRRFVSNKLWFFSMIVWVLRFALFEIQDQELFSSILRWIHLSNILRSLFWKSWQIVK
jgi:NHS family xanthosine MFS transporter